MRKGLLLMAVFAGFVVAKEKIDDKELLKMARQYFKPLPKVAENPQNPVTPEKVKLGKMLYYDPRLSKSGLISCNTCHNLARYGVDNLPTSIGHRWAIGPRNAPTVYNAAIHIAQFWDGRAKDVEEQALGPIVNPIEMANTEENAVKTLKSIPEYVELFKKAFPNEKDPVKYENIGKAIGAFERTLMTPSRFDEFLKGNTKALTEQEKRGLKTFIEVGCVACHNGPGVGGNMFAKFGMITEYWKVTYPYVLVGKPAIKVDFGRFGVTKKEEDMFVFKVPSLRNIEHTYPYFHDGSVWSLEDAVRIMAKTQLGKELTDQQVKDIVAFLKALTGKIPKHALEVPELPPSTDKTPKPEL
ncbi:cytochrome-c peroxidase [Aquifex aeolicus]|uniref:Cytochrome c peroxidase n=1 Tax=Aquifex aeolicus (strain VF5) TaxID=224324 RepID=O66533_AQUAE|nr:cytochrome-c peroxidase [Aquifex aeolicus]AAC06485.1 cytochrome c peroxidase [Aquifex aeolicus VF5]